MCVFVQCISVIIKCSQEYVNVTVIFCFRGSCVTVFAGLRAEFLHCTLFGSTISNTDKSRTVIPQITTLTS